MGNVVKAIVGSPKRPAPPDPAIGEALTRREERAAASEARQKKIVSARGRSRSRGGLASLMTPGVDAQAEGRQRVQSSLGYARNPQGSA